jgi:penicillin amidase
MLDGLDARVRLVRCAAGIDLIQASSLPDAIAGLGYVTGRDRLFQLDMLRRQAAGRVAELLGQAAVESDVRQRRLDLPTAARWAFAALPSRHRELLERYAAGVNSAMAQQPPPFEHRLLGVTAARWQPADSMLVALYLGQLLSDDGRHILSHNVMRDCLPPSVVEFLLSDADPYRVDLAGRPLEAAGSAMPVADIRRLVAEAHRHGMPSRLVVADDEPWGSNAVALAGRRTADGRAILSCDMHLPLTAPPLFYRAALEWGGDRVDGATVPGLPVLVSGSTGSLAWGPTRLGVDTVDVVALEGSSQMHARVERVAVREGLPVEAEVFDSARGPVFGATADGRPVARGWSCLQPGGIDLGLADLLLARDVEAGCEIAARSRGAPLNMLFADREGRVAWTMSGLGGAGRWPAVADPPDGVIVNANNRTPGHPEGNHFSAARAARIGDLIAGQPHWTERELLAVQADVRAEFYEFYRCLALTVLDGPALANRPDLVSLSTGLHGWDGTAAPDAVGLAALVLFRELAREAWFSCLLAGCVAADQTFAYRWHNHEAPLRALLADHTLAPAPYRDRASFLVAQLDLTVLMLERMAPGVAPGDVTWATINRAGIRHPLSAPFPDLGPTLDISDQPLPGCPETVNASRPGFGAAFRLVASPSHPADALTNLPGGQSGDPFNPGYRDQFAAWLAAVPTPLRAEPLPGAEASWLRGV